MTLEHTANEHGIQHPTDAELMHARDDVLNRWQETPSVKGPLDEYADLFEQHFMHPETNPYMFSVIVRTHGLAAIKSDALRSHYEHALRVEQ